MNSNFEYYKIFYYVAKYENLTKAATVLKTSQPAVTRTIHKLENELGCRLFTRSKTGMQLTPEGRTFYGYVAAGCAQFFKGENDLSNLISLENGTIYKAELDRAKIDLNEFLAQARVAGYFDLNEVQCAMLETSGQISFLPKSFNRPVTPQDLAIQTDPASKWYDLVLDGKLIEENLHTSGKDRTWLNTQLSRTGIGQLSETFYAACDNQDNFFACRGE